MNSLIDYFWALTTFGALLILAVVAVYKTVRLWMAGSLGTSFIAALRSDYEHDPFNEQDDERYM